MPWSGDGVIDDLAYNISGTDVRICAPQRLHRVLGRMMRPGAGAGGATPLQLDVRFEGETWSIAGRAPASKKVLAQRTALPQVAGAVIAALLSEISYHTDVHVWRAAVVERDGNALVLAGEDWESCITLAVHLHTRGWRLLGGDYALVSRDTFSASCVRKALHATSSCVGSFPLSYRSAVEASPWYATSDLLAFYAIDPALAGDESPWAERAPIRALLNVDGQTAEHAALETCDELVLAGGIVRRDLIRGGVEVLTLVRSEYNETCDFVERWFAHLISERDTAGRASAMGVCR